MPVKFRLLSVYPTSIKVCYQFYYQTQNQNNYVLGCVKRSCFALSTQFLAMVSLNRKIKSGYKSAV